MERKNKIAFSALLLCLIFAVSSCKNDKTKTVSYNLEERTVWSYLGAGEDDFEIRPVDVQNVFLTVGVPYDITKVTTAKLTSLKAQITEGTLSDFTKIDVFIKLSGASGDGRRVAHLESIPVGATSVQLTLDGAELKDYLGTQSTVTIKTASSGYYDAITLKGGVIQAEVKE